MKVSEKHYQKNTAQNIAMLLSGIFCLIRGVSYLPGISEGIPHGIRLLAQGPFLYFWITAWVALFFASLYAVFLCKKPRKHILWGAMSGMIATWGFGYMWGAATELASGMGFTTLWIKAAEYIFAGTVIALLAQPRRITQEELDQWKNL